MNERYLLPNKEVPWKFILTIGIAIPIFFALVYEAAFRFVFRNFDFATKIPAEIVVTYFNLPLFLGEVLITGALLFGILAMIYVYVKFGARIFEDNTSVGKKVKR